MICCLSKRHTRVLPKCLEWNNKFHTKFHMESEKRRIPKGIVYDLGFLFSGSMFVFLLAGFISLISHRFHVENRHPIPRVSPIWRAIDPDSIRDECIFTNPWMPSKSTIHVGQIFSTKTGTWGSEGFSCIPLDPILRASAASWFNTLALVILPRPARRPTTLPTRFGSPGVDE